MAFWRAMRHSPPMRGKTSDEEDGGLAHRAKGLRRALIRYFARYLGGSDEIEDLVQDVFARIVARDSATPVEHLSSYIYRTAASVLADRGRRRGTRQAERHIEFDPELHGGVDFDAARIFDGKVELERAMASLLSLPERTRTIFVLLRMEGISQRDIAGRLGISVSAVEKHMIRAARHLAKMREEQS